VEAAGLWLEKHWAEWVAVIGASIWLPFEIAKIVKAPSDEFGFVVLGVNLAIVAYLGWVLAAQLRDRKAQKMSAPAQPQPEPGKDRANPAGF